MTKRSAACLAGAVLLLLLLAIGACSPSATAGPSTAPPTPNVTGTVHAGPVCPVETPGDPACADRPVNEAVLVVTTAAGAEVARATSAADGTFVVTLAPGDYILVPQPVAGLMGTAQPTPFHVQGEGAAGASLDVAYDTGIR